MVQELWQWLLRQKMEAKPELQNRAAAPWAL